MAALTALMTRFYAGEDSWLARSKNNAGDAGTPEAKNNKDKSRHNRYKRRNNSDNTEDTSVNAGFRGSKSAQRKKSFQRTIQAHTSWTAYLIVCARFMAPQTNHPIIQIEIAGLLNRPAN